MLVINCFYISFGPGSVWKLASYCQHKTVIPDMVAATDNFFTGMVLLSGMSEFHFDACNPPLDIQNTKLLQ